MLAWHTTSVSIFFVLFAYRGKGDSPRLGHATDGHYRHPKQVERLASEKVIYLAVGSMHCLAITEEGDVYSWGRNDQGQLGETGCTVSRQEPALVTVLEGKDIRGVACGPSQVSDLEFGRGIE